MRNMMAGVLPLPLLVLLLAGCGASQRGIAPPPPGGSGPDPFQTTGSLAAARKGATATFISTGPLSGLVLVAGGEDRSSTALASAELYNPATGTFSQTGSMTTPRAFHTATLLTNGPLHGDVLITGGIDNLGDVLSSAEVFDAVTATFRAVGSMSYSAKKHVAVSFNFTSGSTTTTYVLVAGGQTSSGGLLNNIEIFDPATETFSGGGNMIFAREDFTATALATPPDASTTTSLKVLMAGGLGNSGSPVSSAELYTIGGSRTSTPYNGTSAATGAMVTPRYDHTATFLTGTSNSTMPTTCARDVLIAGGFDSNGDVLNTGEVYSGGVFIAVTRKMANDRVYHTATRVGVNRTTEVLLAGGYSAVFGGLLNTAELFIAPSSGSCSAGSFTATGGPMQGALELHAAVRLRSESSANAGDVLIVGGQGNEAQVLNSAELYRP